MWTKIKNYIQAIVAIAGVLFLMLFLNQCNQTRKLKKELARQEQIAKQNYAALNDSIKVYKNLLGETSFSKPIAEMNAEDIKKYFPSLYDRLKAELGEVKIIWKTQFVYKDTGSVINAIVKLDSNEYALKYDYYSTDSSLHIKSSNTFFANPILVDKEKNQYSIITKSGISTIDDVSLKMGFTTGIKKEGDLYKIFITPSSSKIVITQLEGADVSNMINPPISPTKNKRWSIGLYIGYGIAFGSDGKYTLGPGVGISLQYSILKF